MSLNSARPNTWMAVSVDPASELSYAPQVNPSPLTVGSGKGSLEIVITNATNADINVMHVVFTIKVAPIANNDGNALTSTTADIKTAVSDQNWTVVKPAAPVSSGPANYTLQPMVGHYLPLLKGRSIVVQIYGFPTNTTAGTSTIEIKEVIGTTLPGKIAHPHFTVTTFPWGFAFSDLAANVPDGSGWKPVAQVENGQIVTLFWHGSVVDTGSYTIYYSNSQGQQTATPTRLGQWRSPALTEDTVFTLGVVTNNSVGEKLKASMSVAVAVRNPDLVAKSVTAQNATLKGLTIGPAGNQQPSWTIDSSGTSLRFNNSSTPAATASLGLAGELSATALTAKRLTVGPAGNQQPSWTIDSSGTSLRFNNSSNSAATASLGLTGELSATALIAGKDGAGPANPCALVAHGDLAISSRVFVGDTTDAKKDGKRVPTKGLVLDGAYKWDKFLPAPRLRFIENIDQTKEPNTHRHWNIDAFSGLLRFVVEPGYDQSGKGLASLDTKGNLTLLGSAASNPAARKADNGLNVIQEIDFVKPDGSYISDMWVGLLDWGDNNRWLHLGGCTLNSDKKRRVWLGGTTHVEGDLFVNGEIYKYWKDKNRYEYLGGDGGTRTTQWHPSDLRLKRDVEPVPSALGKVRRLRGVTFSWNEDALQHFTRDIETTLFAGPNATESENQEVWQAERDKRRNQLSTTQVGVLAQDVEAVLPEAVTTDADGHKLVRYDNLIPLLIEAVKEQDRLALQQQVEIKRLKLAVGLGESPDASEPVTTDDHEKQLLTRGTPDAG